MSAPEIVKTRPQLNVVGVYTTYNVVPGDVKLLGMLIGNLVLLGTR